MMSLRRLAVITAALGTAALVSASGTGCTTTSTPTDEGGGERDAKTVTLDSIPVDTAVVDLSSACLMVCGSTVPTRVVLYRDGRALVDDDTVPSGLVMHNAGRAAVLAMTKQAASALAGKPRIDTESQIADGVAVSAKVVTDHRRWTERLDNPGPRGWPQFHDLLSSLRQQVKATPGGAPFDGGALAYLSEATADDDASSSPWPFPEPFDPATIRFRKPRGGPAGASGCLAVTTTAATKYRTPFTVLTGRTRPLPQSVSVTVHPRLPGESCAGQPGPVRIAGQWGNSAELAPDDWARLGPVDDAGPVDEFTAWTALGDGRAAVASAAGESAYIADAAYRGVRVGTARLVDIRFRARSASGDAAWLVRVDPATGAVSTPLRV